jgi:M6 family metalloprotease-like protein
MPAASLLPVKGGVALVVAVALGAAAQPAQAAAPAACAPSPAFPAVTEGRSAPGTVASATGVLRGVILTVEFPNATAAYPPAEHLAPVEQASAWYQALSRGRLTLSVTGLGRWLRMPLPSDAYSQDAGRYLADAIASADPYVDFSQVDIVYLVPVEGATGFDAGSAVLNSFGVHADGKEVRYWVSFANGFGRSDPDPWVLIHETGHLLGLPDLYVQRAPETFHRWDVMAARYPAELFAWHRWKLGWLDPAEIVCITGRTSRRVTLSPLGSPGGPKALLVRRGNEVVVAEVRQRLGYDSGLCDPGVLIYRVTTTPLQRSPVQLYRARGAPRARVGRCGNVWNATFGVGRGKVSRFRIPQWRLEIRVLARRADGAFRVRATAR